MSQLEVRKLFMRLAAYGRVGHARVDFPGMAYEAYAASGGVILPVELRFRQGRAFVAASHSPEPRLRPGAELVTLDGRPVAEWVAQLGRYGGAERPAITHAALESWPGFARLLWLERGRVDTFRLGVRHEGGPVQELTIPAIAVRRVDGAISRRESASGRFARTLRMHPDGIAVLHPGPFYDTGGGDPAKGEYDSRRFGAFVDSAFREIIRAGARDLVIDVRDNPGGDNSFSDRIVAWFATRPFRFSSSYMLKASPQTRGFYRLLATRKLPADDAAGVGRLNEALSTRPDGERFPFAIPMVDPRTGERFTGRVYVLVNRYSYSNATSVAALIQDYGFGRVIGEETADLPTTYASVAQFTLPRTGIVVTYPKGYFVRPNRDTTPRGVVPDVMIASPVVSPPAGEDPVLDAAMRAVVAAR